MEKEPITLNGLNKLKEELVFLKEKKDPKLLRLLLKPDHMVISKKMRSITLRKKSNHTMKEELLK